MAAIEGGSTIGGGISKSIVRGPSLRTPDFASPIRSAEGSIPFHTSEVAKFGGEGSTLHRTAKEIAGAPPESIHSAMGEIAKGKFLQTDHALLQRVRDIDISDNSQLGSESPGYFALKHGIERARVIKGEKVTPQEDGSLRRNDMPVPDADYIQLFEKAVKDASLEASSNTAFSAKDALFLQEKYLHQGLKSYRETHTDQAQEFTSIDDGKTWNPTNEHSSGSEATGSFVVKDGIQMAETEYVRIFEDAVARATHEIGTNAFLSASDAFSLQEKYVKEGIQDYKKSLDAQSSASSNEINDVSINKEAGKNETESTYGLEGEDLAILDSYPDIKGIIQDLGRLSILEIKIITNEIRKALEEEDKKGEKIEEEEKKKRNLLAAVFGKLILASVSLAVKGK